MPPLVSRHKWTQKKRPWRRRSTRSYGYRKSEGNGAAREVADGFIGALTS
jgi:hypothetical protein